MNIIRQSNDYVPYRKRSYESQRATLEAAQRHAEQYFEAERQRERAQEMEAARPEQRTEKVDLGRQMMNLTEQRSAEIMSNLRMDGDPWRQGCREYNLTKENLEMAGLAPEYAVIIEGQGVALSNLYKADGRLAVMAYVPTTEGIKARSYYMSKSQGVWR